MCFFGGSSKTADPVEPTRYQQQRTPTAQDAVDAQGRAEVNRRKATKTILASYTAPDKGAKAGLLDATDTTTRKTLLGV